MAFLHALALLLVLVPLAVTAIFTVEPTDTVFERDRRSDALPHGILELGHESYGGSIDQQVNVVNLRFIGHEMPVCLAGACDVSEIRHGLDFHRR
jgi:hypothetical protein